MIVASAALAFQLSVKTRISEKNNAGSLERFGFAGKFFAMSYAMENASQVTLRYNSSYTAW
jgi:hypothetical protein